MTTSPRPWRVWEWSVIVAQRRHIAKAQLILPLWDNKVSAGIEALYSSERLTVSGANDAGFVVLAASANGLTLHNNIVNNALTSTSSSAINSLQLGVSPSTNSVAM